MSPWSAPAKKRKNRPQGYRLPDFDKSPDGYRADQTAAKRQIRQQSQQSQQSRDLRRRHFEQEHYLRSLQVLRAQLEWPPLELYDRAMQTTPRLPGPFTLP